jgi:ribosomal protein S27E
MSAAPPNPPNVPRRPSRPSVVPRAVGLNCPGCGAPLTLRTFSNAVNVTCSSCGRILDATDPKLTILQEAHRKFKMNPLIPLGTRGKWKGVTYEVVGFQERTITSEGVEYHWYEYLLFNPYAGYRYLTEYQGHWNDVTVCHALPKPLPGSRNLQVKPQVELGGRTYKQFQTAMATTTYILGEFPWQVRTGDKVQARDFISPPFMLSSESTDEETTWSLGEYTPGKDIWQAFGMKGSPPDQAGVYANQPNPYGDRPKSFWNLGGYFITAAVLLFIVLAIMAQHKEVLHESYTHRHAGL